MPRGFDDLFPLAVWVLHAVMAVALLLSDRQPIRIDGERRYAQTRSNSTPHELLT